MSTSGLARYLIKEGLLSESDCQLIARDHGNTGAAFAKVVVSLGVLSEEKLALFLADKTRLPMLPHRQFCTVKPGAESALALPLMKSLEVVPVELNNGQLIVAMADPLDQDTMQQLRFFTSYRIKPVIATFTTLYKSLENLVQGFSPEKTTLQKLLALHTPEPVPVPVPAPQAEFRKPEVPSMGGSADEDDDGFWDTPEEAAPTLDEPDPEPEVDAESELDSFDEFEDGSLDEFADADANDAGNETPVVEDEDFPMDSAASKTAFAGVDLDDLEAADPLPEFDPALLPESMQETAGDLNAPGTESWDDIMGGQEEEKAAPDTAQKTAPVGQLEAGGGLFFDDPEPSAGGDTDEGLAAGGGMLFDEPESTAAATTAPESAAPEAGAGDALMFDEPAAAVSPEQPSTPEGAEAGDALLFDDPAAPAVETKAESAEAGDDDLLFGETEAPDGEQSAVQDQSDDGLLFGDLEESQEEKAAPKSEEAESVSLFPDEADGQKDDSGAETDETQGLTGLFEDEGHPPADSLAATPEKSEPEDDDLLFGNMNSDAESSQPSEAESAAPPAENMEATPEAVDQKSTEQESLSALGEGEGETSPEEDTPVGEVMSEGSALEGGGEEQQSGQSDEFEAVDDEDAFEAALEDSTESAVAAAGIESPEEQLPGQNEQSVAEGTDGEEHNDFTESPDADSAMGQESPEGSFDQNSVSQVAAPPEATAGDQVLEKMEGEGGLAVALETTGAEEKETRPEPQDDASLLNLSDEFEELASETPGFESPGEEDLEMVEEIAGGEESLKVPAARKHTKQHELGAGFLNHAMAGVSLSMNPEKAAQAMSQGMVKAGIKKGVVYRVKDQKVIYVSQWGQAGGESERLKNADLSGLQPPEEESPWQPLSEVPSDLAELQEDTDLVMVHWGPEENKGRGLTVAGWNKSASESAGIQNLSAGLTDRFFKKAG